MKLHNYFSYIFLLFIGTLFTPIAASAQCFGNFQGDIQSAPTLVGQTVTSSCIAAGDYLTITGMQAGNIYEISTCTFGSFDTELTLWDAAFATVYAFDDDGCGTLSSLITFTPSITGDYQAVLTELGCFATVGLCSEIEVTLLGAAPANDLPCDAIPLLVNTPYIYDNIGATFDAGEIIPPLDSCYGNAGWCEADVQTTIWFTFVAPASGSVEINACGANTNFDTQLAVYSVGNCSDYNTFTFIGGNDDGPTCVGYASDLFVSCLVPGSTYYLAIDGYLGDMGTVEFEIIPLSSNTTLSTSATGPVCPTNLTGTATVNVVGNVIPYTYSWSNGGTTNTITDVPGLYTVFVMDGCGMVYNTTVTIPAYSVPAPPTAITNGIAPSCASGNGLANIIVNGVAGPYTFSWSTGATGNTISALPGTYTVSITDVCGTTSATSSIIIPNAPQALVVDAGAGGTICAGSSVTLNGSTTGGVLPNRLVGYGYEAISTNFSRFSLTNPGVVTPIGAAIGLDLFAGDIGPNGYYVLDFTNNQLLRVDTTTGGLTLMGASTPLGLHQWTGLAWNPNNSTMYAVATDGVSSSIYTINTTNGTATYIAPLATPLPIWIAINTQGMAYTLDLADDNIYQVNLTTGEVILIGYAGFDANYAQDADFDGAGNLYLAAYNNVSLNAELRLANLVTGNTTLVGTLGAAGATEFTTLGIANNPAASYQYSWSPTTGLSNPNILNPIATPSVTTTYTLTVTDACGTSTDNVTITVQAAPTVNLGPNVVACQSTLLDAGSGNGYLYNWCNGVTTQTQTVTTSGMYCVTVTNPAGCSDSDSVNVTINPNPVLNLGADVSGCGSVVLNGGAGFSTYTWCNGVIGQTQTVNTSGMYCLTITNSNGCSDIDSINVTINTNPVANAGADTTICLGQSLTLVGTATGGAAPYTYTWSAGTVVTPTTSSAYTLDVTDANGCTGTDGITVNVNPIPVADAGADIAICIGDTATLTVNTTAGVGPFTYSWSNGVTTVSQDVIPAITTTYTVTSTDAIGCTSTLDAITVTVNPLPPVPTITQAGSVLTSSSATGNQWYLNGAPISGQTGTSYTATVSGDYHVCVTNGSGCTSCSNAISLSVAIENSFFSLPISIYPNPMQQGLNIVPDANGGNNVYQVSIYNYLGQTMYVSELQKDKLYIPTENWAIGVYSIQFVSEGKVVGSAKVVKE